MQTSPPDLLLGVPFVGVLASIALIPMLAPRFWRRRMGYIAFAWSAALVVMQSAMGGAGVAVADAWQSILIDYLPFVTMLLALYTAGGGVLLRGGPAGSPLGNTMMLAIGMVMGVFMGTTGAAMVLIHPLIYANAHRQRKFHLVLFLIALVANASGAITPLGNPPLYIGLLHGVPFFWPARHLFGMLLLVSVLLLAAFYLIDRYLNSTEQPLPERTAFRIRGWWNIALIMAVIVIVLLQGVVHTRTVTLLGQPVGIGHLAVVAVFTVITLISIRVTPRAIRQGNDFTWHPIAEVAMLFAAIFITISPVIDMLHARLDGPLAPLLRLTLDSAGQPMPLAFFWMTGLLSAFLDNAPAYLVFFELAGLNPAMLSGAQEIVLMAISSGAVLFGGLTYIGNAPNMMLRSIAAHRGVRMPGFFGFMALSSCLLLPVFALLSVVFFA